MTEVRKFANTRIACGSCGHPWSDIFLGGIEVEGKATEASLEYRKCASCGEVDQSSIFIVIAPRHDPNEGDMYSLHVPAVSDAWETPQGSWFGRMLSDSAFSETGDKE